MINNWSDQVAVAEYVCELDGQSEDYQPGEFYRRELPCLLDAIERAPHPPKTIVVDGYVWLDVDLKEGLGGKLYQALNGKCEVVGVAKNHFRGAPAVEIFRGQSKRPLYVTSAGMELEKAVECIGRMHGTNRIPFHLKRHDQIARNPMKHRPLAIFRTTDS